MPIDVSNPAGLEVVKGKSDEEIITLAQESEGGVAAVCDKMLEGMVQSFKPEAAAGKSVVIQYELGTPDGVRAYTLTVDNGTCTLDKSGTDSARVTMQMAIQDFLRLAAGDLDGMKAFMGGKLKLKGDMMFAQQMQNWFGQS